MPNVEQLHWPVVSALACTFSKVLTTVLQAPVIGTVDFHPPQCHTDINHSAHLIICCCCCVVFVFLTFYWHYYCWWWYVCFLQFIDNKYHAKAKVRTPTTGKWTLPQSQLQQLAYLPQPTKAFVTKTRVLDRGACTTQRDTNESSHVDG